VKRPPTPPPKRSLAREALDSRTELPCVDVTVSGRRLRAVVTWVGAAPRDGLCVCVAPEVYCGLRIEEAVTGANMGGDVTLGMPELAAIVAALRDVRERGRYGR